MTNPNECKPDREAFDYVYNALSKGESLNLRMLGMIFGQPFWELIVIMLTGLQVKNIGGNVNITVNEKM